MTVKVKKFTPKDHGVCDLEVQVQGELQKDAHGKLVYMHLGQRIQLDVHPINQPLLDDSGAGPGDPKSGPGAETPTD